MQYNVHTCTCTCTLYIVHVPEEITTGEFTIFISFLSLSLSPPSLSSLSPPSLLLLFPSSLICLPHSSPSLSPPIPLPSLALYLSPSLCLSGSSKDPDHLYKLLIDLVERLPNHNRYTLETILTHLVK